jgi:hypothetical protein
LAAQMALSRSVKICQDPSRQGANDICLNGLCLHGEQKLQSILPLLTSRVDQWLPKGGSPILCLYEYGLIWDDLGGDTGDTSILGNPQIAYQWCETAVYGKTMVIYGKLSSLSQVMGVFMTGWCQPLTVKLHQDMSLRLVHADMTELYVMTSSLTSWTQEFSLSSRQS